MDDGRLTLSNIAEHLYQYEKGWSIYAAKLAEETRERVFGWADYLAAYGGRSSSGQDSRYFIAFWTTTFSLIPREEFPRFFRDYWKKLTVVASVREMSSRNVRVCAGVCACGKYWENIPQLAAKKQLDKSHTWNLWTNLDEPPVELCTRLAASTGSSLATASLFAHIHGVCSICKWACASCGASLPTSGPGLVSAIVEDFSCPICASNRLTKVQPPKPNRAELKVYRSKFTVVR
jgi:DNA-directed RNA polymerase subunit RPC12/RpoP